MLAKYTATWIEERDKHSVSLFEDPDQRAKGSLDLPLEVHLQAMYELKSSSKTTDSKNNNEGTKKCLQLVSWNTMKQGKAKNNRWFLSDTFYPLVAEAFKTKQTFHRIYNLGVFFKGNKERAERAFPPIITAAFGGRSFYVRS